jgi:hypothetical protein
MVTLQKYTRGACRGVETKEYDARRACKADRRQSIYDFTLHHGAEYARAGHAFAHLHGIRLGRQRNSLRRAPSLLSHEILLALFAHPLKTLSSKKTHRSGCVFLWSRCKEHSDGIASLSSVRESNPFGGVAAPKR